MLNNGWAGGASLGGGASLVIVEVGVGGGVASSEVPPTLGGVTTRVAGSVPTLVEGGVATLTMEGLDSWVRGGVPNRTTGGVVLLSSLIFITVSLLIRLPLLMFTLKWGWLELKAEGLRKLTWPANLSGSILLRRCIGPPVSSWDLEFTMEWTATLGSGLLLSAQSCDNMVDKGLMASSGINVPVGEGKFDWG